MITTTFKYIYMTSMLALSLLTLGEYTHAQGTMSTGTHTMPLGMDHAQMPPTMDPNQMPMPTGRAGEQKEIRENRRGMLTENIQNRITNLGQNVTLRLTSVIKRFEHIIARIDSRINKLKAESVDTTEAESKRNEAKKLLTDTTSMLGTMSSVRNAVSSDTPRESFQLVRAQFITVRDNLRQTHLLLQETVVLLKASRTSQATNQSATENTSENSTSTLVE